MLVTGQLLTDFHNCVLCKFYTTSSLLTYAAQQPSLSMLPNFIIFRSYVWKVFCHTFRHHYSAATLLYRGQTQEGDSTATKVENKSTLVLTNWRLHLTYCKSSETSMAIQSIWTLFCTVPFNSSRIVSVQYELIKKLSSFHAVYLFTDTLQQHRDNDTKHKPSNVCRE